MKKAQEEKGKRLTGSCERWSRDGGRNAGTERKLFPTVVDALLIIKCVFHTWKLSLLPRINPNLIGLMSSLADLEKTGFIDSLLTSVTRP